jgi:hypothetical protein
MSHQAYQPAAQGLSSADSTDLAPRYLHAASSSNFPWLASMASMPVLPPCPEYM